ncbi:MAG: nitronate monooxygenase [Defluviitaleaceae bacterium]|nr:nitronate monooxygenase [Defluviitaleaceae bacterium]
MNFKPLNISGLIADIPIIQGGMGVGVSLSGLAGAVAKEGGIGVIAAAQIGFNLPGFVSNPFNANLEALSYHIKKAKEKALGGVVGVNIMCAVSHYADYVKCSIENKADLIISGAGLPLNLPELVKGSATKIAPIVSSVKAAAVLLKLWDKKYSTTADMIIVEGPKAGGHLGFTLEELENEVDFSENLKKIISEVSNYEEKYNKKIPTIFGGGIFDKHDIEYYLNLGLAGVQMATRFAATEECDAHENFKFAYVNAKQNDAVIVKSPIGLPGRALNNEFIRKVTTGGKTLIEKCHSCIADCNPKNIPYCITNALINSVTGNVDQGLIFCGDTVHKINEITTVKKLMKELSPC